MKVVNRMQIQMILRKLLMKINKLSYKIKEEEQFPLIKISMK